MIFFNFEIPRIFGRPAGLFNSQLLLLKYVMIVVISISLTPVLLIPILVQPDKDNAHMLRAQRAKYESATAQKEKEHEA